MFDWAEVDVGTVLRVPRVTQWLVPTYSRRHLHDEPITLGHRPLMDLHTLERSRMTARPELS